jgi:hypothetical protein
VYRDEFKKDSRYCWAGCSTEEKSAIRGWSVHFDPRISRRPGPVGHRSGFRGLERRRTEETKAGVLPVKPNKLTKTDGRRRVRGGLGWACDLSPSINASNIPARRVIQCGRKNMREQVEKNRYFCDCEHCLPCAVRTVWICQHCGDLHERVTNCACGKCVQFEETRDPKA